MASYTPPQSIKVTSAAPVTWSSGAAFTGYILFGLALPKDANGVQWGQVNYQGSTQRLPLWAIFPIVEGVIDTNTGVFPNSQVDPPNTYYAIYWYDNTWKQVYPFPYGTLATLVSIPTTNPYVISVPTLTAPTAPDASLTPTPQAPTSSASAATVPSYPNQAEYTLTGTVNSINTVFTIPVSAVLFASVYIDGQKQDASTYSRTGVTVTFTTAPLTGSSVTAVVSIPF